MKDCFAPTVTVTSHEGSHKQDDAMLEVEVGCIQDSYFIGALASLSAYPQDYAARIIVSSNRAALGLYTVKFWKDQQV